MFATNGGLKNYALNQWANYIETRDICLSAGDAIKQGKPNNIRHLNESQKKTVALLRALAVKELSDKTPTGIDLD